MEMYMRHNLRGIRTVVLDDVEISIAGDLGGGAREEWKPGTEGSTRTGREVGGFFSMGAWD